MSVITREQVIKYLDGLGDPVDWDNSDNDYTAESQWTLEEIRAEVLEGDKYDGMTIWQDILDTYGADDIRVLHPEEWYESRKEFNRKKSAAMVAIQELSEAWNGEAGFNGNTEVNLDLYPSYLPSFDEFSADFTKFVINDK